MLSTWIYPSFYLNAISLESGNKNEITAIPLLLDLLDLEGATVTIDAMGCQKEISDKIREKNADYIFSLKGNHSNLHDDVRLYFETLQNKKLSAEVFHSYQVEKDHGRIEENGYCWQRMLDQITCILLFMP